MCLVSNLMDYSNQPIELRALDSLGLGFDVASDFRLKFAKSCPDGGRLVELDESRKRDIVLPGCGTTISGVSEDIRCDKGDRIRFKSDVLEFNKVITCSFTKIAFYFIFSMQLEFMCDDHIPIRVHF